MDNRLWKNFPQNVQYQMETAESSETENDRETKKQRENSAMTSEMSQDEDGDVQDLAVLKRIKGGVESDEKNNFIIAIIPSRASLTLKMFFKHFLSL